MTVMSLYAGILGLIYLALSYRVVAFRRSQKVGLGDGDNVDLQRAIRVHANFMEYVPLCLILMFLLEQSHNSNVQTHVFGAVLVIARLLHAYGLGKISGTSFGRFWGTLLTWLLLLGLAVANIAFYLLNIAGYN